MDFWTDLVTLFLFLLVILTSMTYLNRSEVHKYTTQNVELFLQHFLFIIIVNECEISRHQKLTSWLVYLPTWKAHKSN